MKHWPRKETCFRFMELKFIKPLYSYYYGGACVPHMHVEVMGWPHAGTCLLPPWWLLRLVMWSGYTHRQHHCLLRHLASRTAANSSSNIMVVFRIAFWLQPAEECKTSLFFGRNTHLWCCLGSPNQQVFLISSFIFIFMKNNGCHCDVFKHGSLFFTFFCPVSHCFSSSLCKFFYFYVYICVYIYIYIK